MTYTLLNTLSRQHMVQRENERWAAQAHEEKKKDDYYERARNDPSRGKAVKNSMAYNPITLQYNDNTDGARLQFHDDAAKVRFFILEGR